MEITALIRFFAPQLATVGDETLSNAVSLAENYRPRCLPEAKQAEAVALYAVYLLLSQQEAQAVPVGITAEKEGDLSRSYGDNGLNGAQSYLARYEALASVCRRLGAITVGNNG